MNEKASQSTSSPFNDEGFNYDEINRNLEEFALALAKEMANPEIRKLIKTEAMKQFDGDYDILYKNFKNLKMQNGLSVEEHLQQKNSNVRTQASKIPKFQISVPVNCEGWDTDNYIPLVVIAPQAQGIIERDIKQLKAFDHKGNVYFIDGQKVPDKPVIVLGRSERTDDNGNLYDGLVNHKPISNGRGENSAERLGRIYFPDASLFEHWSQGQMEFRLTVAASQNGTTVSKLIDNSLYTCGRECGMDQNGPGTNDDGCYYGDFLFTWNTSYGNAISYGWLEWDDTGSNSPTTLSVSYQTGNSPTISLSTEVSRKSGDIWIGGWTVWRTEPSNWTYGTRSSFTFQVFF
ncbi:hypothetical protein [Thermoflexibacter ruber]|uniref:Uncharacterized protein n=1 Tax=Thermoflexibacter ruber TaxID=1003 RepID=A0A1I2KD18_9BACT|nr:hypothetical protein [Thermoflexibacter ruber]SFF64248.1 hypothetical protein SAMN04488541_11052 [Thermoflexibacter ruber]